MKQLFLTSSISGVVKDVATKINVQKHPNLVYIYTAAEGKPEGKAAAWNVRDRDKLIGAGFEVTEYTIVGKTESELRHDLAPYDVIYMGGGNVFYLLHYARQTKFDVVLHDLVHNQDRIYIGTSAGSIIAGPTTLPFYNEKYINWAPKLHDYTGFAMVNFLIQPHWGSKKRKSMMLNERMPQCYVDTQVPLLLLTDNHYVHIQGDYMEIIDVTTHI